MSNTSNLDEYTVVRSDNRDVERVQLNKILRRLAVNTGAAIEWGDILGTLGDQTDLATVLDGKADDVHTHVISDVTGLQTALDGKEAVGTAAAAVAAHEALADPHPQYLTLAEGGAAYQPLDSQLTDLAALSYTGNAGKVIAVNGGETAFELVTPSGGGGGGISWSTISSAATLTADTHTLCVFSTQQDVTLPAFTAGDFFVIANSGDSAADARVIVGVSNTINRTGFSTGDNLLIAPGETAYLVAESSTELDLV